jgi:hypothetical protein
VTHNSHAIVGWVPTVPGLLWLAALEQSVRGWLFPEPNVFTPRMVVHMHDTYVLFLRQRGATALALEMRRVCECVAGAFRTLAQVMAWDPLTVR